MGETCASAATVVTATPPSSVWLYDGRTPGTAVAVERKDSAGWSHFLFFLRMLTYTIIGKRKTHARTHSHNTESDNYENINSCVYSWILYFWSCPFLEFNNWWTRSNLFFKRPYPLLRLISSEALKSNLETSTTIDLMTTEQYKWRYHSEQYNQDLAHFLQGNKTNKKGNQVR